MRLLCAVVILAGVFFASPLTAQSPIDTVVYDGYRWGIHTFTLSVEGGGDGATYRLTRKDLQANRWGEPEEASAAAMAGNDDFRLAGAIANFPANLASLSSTEWTSNQAVGWPDENSVYVRRREINEQVDGKSVTATYWAVRDGTLPMDLVIGPDNELIAGIDVRSDQVMVRRGYEAFTTVKRWREASVSQPDYGYRALDLAMVPNRSVVKLATQVYLPAGDIEAPFPTIFIRLPYGINNLFGSTLIEMFKHYPIRGYALVAQAAKGTAYWDPESRSEGDWEDMVQEPADGADALEWITQQPWSNGSVCMQGASYLGYTQWALTMANNPALKCLIPESSMGTDFSDQPFMGGTFVMGSAYYVFWMTDNPLLPGRSWIDVLRHRPLIDIDEYATGKDLPVWNNFFKHWRNDAFWKVQDWYEGDHDRDVATLQFSGWFDDDFPGTRSNWALIERYGTKPNRLVLGPWRHGYNADRRLNGYSFGPDAVRDDVWLLKQQWYDYHLKGISNGVTDTKVEYFVLGSNEWREADAWPPPEAQSQHFYFHSTGKANRHPADGRLNRAAPDQSEPPESFRYDPQDPAPNWYSFDLMETWGDVQAYPYDFKDIESRHDLATYTTDVLEEDLTIAGNIKVVLYASADVKDTDWWAYVSDVAPDNSSNRLSVGVLRARFRHLEDPDYHVFGSNFETEDFLSGDVADVVRYEISIPSVANTFKRGHRIRIAITNAQDNYSFPNSNTGGEEGYVTETVVGNMKIHHSPDHPSEVVLPVMAAPSRAASTPTGDPSGHEGTP